MTAYIWTRATADGISFDWECPHDSVSVATRPATDDDDIEAWAEWPTGATLGFRGYDWQETLVEVLAGVIRGRTKQACRCVRLRGGVA